MHITWHGYSCFKIQESFGSNEVTIVTDPFAGEDAAKAPRFAADVVTVSHDHPRHNNVESIGGTPFVITGPGEYEVKDVLITGVPTYHDEVGGKKMGRNTLFFFTISGVHVAHLGDLKHPLEGKHLEDPHPIDILLLPVGGGDVLNAKQAAEIVGQLEPRVVIPMHYKSGKIGAKLDGVDAFLKTMGVTAESMSKFKVTDKMLPQEETIFVTLEPQ
jgi:L-ascorbate metabolism protein UlaG (beta-lactamase superfamily)